MGASIQGRNAGRKRRKLMNEINVTPMVDVMLVLLIIFMITSPMLVAGIEVDLPQTESTPISGSFKPLVISIDKNEELYLFETIISKDTLIVPLVLLVSVSTANVRWNWHRSVLGYRPRDVRILSGSEFDDDALESTLRWDYFRYERIAKTDASN